MKCFGWIVPELKSRHLKRLNVLNQTYSGIINASHFWHSGFYEKIKKLPYSTPNFLNNFNNIMSSIHIPKQHLHINFKILSHVLNFEAQPRRDIIKLHTMSSEWKHISCLFSSAYRSLISYKMAIKIPHISSTPKDSRHIFK